MLLITLQLHITAYQCIIIIRWNLVSKINVHRIRHWGDAFLCTRLHVGKTKTSCKSIIL